jgi:hypothetical protein
MQTRRKQNGMTFISWLVLLIVLGFFVMVGLKVTPVYLEHYAIKKSLESLKEEPLIARKRVTEIRKMLLRRLDMNSIRHIGKDHIKITRSGGVTNISIGYVKEKQLLGNMSLLMTFDDSIELISN